MSLLLVRFFGSKSGGPTQIVMDLLLWAQNDTNYNGFIVLRSNMSHDGIRFVDSKSGGPTQIVLDLVKFYQK